MSDLGNIEDAMFCGKRVGDMERSELLTVISYLSRTVEAERSYPKDFRQMARDKAAEWAAEK